MRRRTSDGTAEPSWSSTIRPATTALTRIPSRPPDHLSERIGATNSETGHQHAVDKAVATADDCERCVRFSCRAHRATVPVSPRCSKTCRSMTVWSMAIAEKKTKRTGPASATAAMASTMTVTSKEILERG
jgi:hypothetical protein